MATKLDPKTACLLLLDIQNVHMSQLPIPEDYFQKISEATSAARKFGLSIVHCRVAFTPADLEAMPQTCIFYQRAKSGQAGAHMDDAESSQFHPLSQPQEGDILIRKTRVGPLVGEHPQNFDKMLRERGIDTLVLAGVATGGVVLSTVVEGVDLDYRIVVLEDGCADSDPDMHKMLMKYFAKRGSVIKCSELEELVEKV